MGTSPQEQSLLNKAKALLSVGKCAEAIPLLQKAADKDLEHFETRFLLGISYFRTASLAGAEQCFREAVRIDNGSHVAHYYLGLTLERQGRSRDAELEFRFALTIKPDFREASEKLSSSRSHVPSQSNPTDKDGALSKNTSAPSEEKAPKGQSNVSLAEKIAGRKEEHAEIRPEQIAGRQEISCYRRMRSFGGHFFLILLVAFIVGIVLVTASEAMLLAFLVPGLLVLMGMLYWRSRSCRYTIYERRVDIHSGLLFKSVASIWLYQIDQVHLTRSPLNLLTGDSKLHLKVAAPGISPVVHIITGLGNRRFMEELWVRLRDRALIERREMKSIWI